MLFRNPVTEDREKRGRLEVPSSNRSVGRLNYVLRILLVTAMAFALEFLGDEFLHLSLLPRYSYALQRVIVFGLVGRFLVTVIDGRLLDIGLPRWYRYPVFAIWLLSISLSTIWPSEWPIGLALFALLLIVGCLIPGMPVTPASVDKIARDEEKAPSLAPIKKLPSKFPPRLLVSPRGFLRSLLTFACLWLPLIWLEGASGQGVGVWVARLGYFILSVIWFFKVLGRLGDAGRLPRTRYGYFVIVCVLLVEMLRRGVGVGRSSQSYGFPFSNAASVASMLTACLKLINSYEMLALFLLIQVPLALLASKPRTAEPVSEKEGSKKHAPAVKTNELALSSPIEYLRILFVIACLWIPLIYMDNASGGSVGSWIARLGYLILGCSWLIFANGRLEDAGWGHSLYPSQYFLVVAVASVMPLGVHWVNGYGALVIFVLVQIPTVFLGSKPVPEEPSPGDSTLTESPGGVPRS
jgi:hypothetical protein